VIHATAIVDTRARLGQGVEIGAYSIVGPDVEIGDRTWIGPHVVVQGPTRIGRENRIHAFCSLGGAAQDLGYKGEPTRLEIGDRNDIREYCTFNRGTVKGGGVTRVGDDNFLLAYCHVAHDCRVGSHTIFANASSLAGHVHVGDYAYLGGFTLIHQFCRVGAHCMTGVNTTLFKDVPPFLMVAGAGGTPHGLNVRGLKRRGFSDATILALKRAYKTLYHSELKLADALAALTADGAAEPDVAHFVAFIQASKRGIVR
jgi:UDP-N-acetylglucosamine acyltransferase